MAKSRESKEAEYYKSQIRKLKKEVKNLRKQLNRNYKDNTDDIDDEYPDEEVQDVQIKCTKCTNGFLEYFQVASREFHRCASCGYRSPGKKI